MFEKRYFHYRKIKPSIAESLLFKKKKLTEKAIWKWVIPAKCNKGLELMF